MRNLIRKSAVLLLAILVGSVPALAKPTKVDTRIGSLKFTQDFAHGYPTDATVKDSMR